MKTSNFITSTLFVSALGVAIGMLFAPKKGTKTRRQISENYHEYSEYLADKFDGFVNSASHPLENNEDEIKKLKRKANKTKKEVTSEVKANVK